MEAEEFGSNWKNGKHVKIEGMIDVESDNDDLPKGLKGATEIDVKLALSLHQKTIVERTPVKVGVSAAHIISSVDNEDKVKGNKSSTNTITIQNVASHSMTMHLSQMTQETNAADVEFEQASEQLHDNTVGFGSPTKSNVDKK